MEAEGYAMREFDRGDRPPLDFASFQHDESLRRSAPRQMTASASHGLPVSPRMLRLLT